MYLLSSIILLLIGAIARTNAAFGQGSGPILLNNVMCAGTEPSLLNCTFSSMPFMQNCSHSDDAGVVCIGKLYVAFPLE